MLHKLFQANPDAGGGGGAPDGAPPAAWFTDEQKPFVETKGWKSPGDAITSFQNLEKLLGADRAGRTVVLPKDDKDVEGIKAYNAKMGVPEAADKYKVPDLLKDDPILPAILQAAHAKGASASTVEAVLEVLAAEAPKMQQQQAAEAKAASEQELSKLKSEWGGDFDKNAEFAKRFLRASGWDEAKVAKYEETFGTAAMLKDFMTWGSKFQESPGAGGGGSPSFTMSKQQATQKLEQIRDDRANGRINDIQWKGGVESEYHKLSEYVSAA